VLHLQAGSTLCRCRGKPARLAGRLTHGAHRLGGAGSSAVRLLFFAQHEVENMAPNKPGSPAKVKEPDALFKELADLDVGIAERWQECARAHGNRKFKLKEDDVKAILFSLLSKDRAVTEKQAKAIMLLVRSGAFSDDGFATLIAYVQIADKYGFLQPGASPLTTTAELKPILGALGMGMISKITFKSPGTGLSYSPSHYLAIKELIAKSKITVLEIRLGGLNIKVGLTTAGNYRTDQNFLYVLDGVPPNKKMPTIVHEVTHAIQDWRDVRTLCKYAEADAYIAGAIADQTMTGGDLAHGGPMFEAAANAARKVIKGQTDQSDQSWTRAYDDVAAEVEKNPGYASVANEAFQTTEKDEGH
jgi:hypothetical protein